MAVVGHESLHWWVMLIAVVGHDSLQWWVMTHGSGGS